MDGGAWWATVHGVAKSQTRLSNFTSLHFTVYRLLTHYLSKERIQSFLSHLLIILFSSLLKNLEGGWASLMAQRVKHSPAMWETWVRSLGQENPLEKEMATHSSTHDWKIPWTEEPGRPQSTGVQRVGHNWATSLSGWWGKTKFPIPSAANRIPKIRWTSLDDLLKKHFTLLLHPWKKKKHTAERSYYSGLQVEIREGHSAQQKNRAGRLESVDSGVRPPGFQFWSSHLSALTLWAGYPAWEAVQ